VVAAARVGGGEPAVRDSEEQVVGYQWWPTERRVRANRAARDLKVGAGIGVRRGQAEEEEEGRWVLLPLGRVVCSILVALVGRRQPICSPAVCSRSSIPANQMTNHA
jgi:hypothetical protein